MLARAMVLRTNLLYGKYEVCCAADSRLWDLLKMPWFTDNFLHF